MIPPISVVIPCYNQGAYLDEAIESARDQTVGAVDLIVVDDGSEDKTTREALSRAERQGARLVVTEREGVEAARNAGIAVASSPVILCLDADDRIAKTYAQQALAILECEPKVGIVYARTRFFGARNESWDMPAYTLSRMLAMNVIPVSAFFRRRLWESAGGYDPGMRGCLEDWDFWLSLIEQGVDVRQLQEELFFYRLKSTGQHRASTVRKLRCALRIFARHRRFYIRHVPEFISGLAGFLAGRSYRQ